MTDFTNEELVSIKEMARHEIILADFIPKMVSPVNIMGSIQTASLLSIKCDQIIAERMELAKKQAAEAKKE